jgi:hypothetical protein
VISPGVNRQGPGIWAEGEQSSSAYFFAMTRSIKSICAHLFWTRLRWVMITALFFFAWELNDHPRLLFLVVASVIGIYDDSRDKAFLAL